MKISAPLRAETVLVNPPIAREQQYGVKFRTGMQTPNLGLALLAAILRGKGRSVAVMDCACEGVPFDVAVARVVSLAPKYVGLTAVTMTVTAAAAFARAVKEALPGVRVIVGGPHITALPEETARRLGIFFDAAVIGEGDETLPELLSAFEGRRTLSSVRGIALPDENGRISFTPPRPPVEDMDTLPFPAWDLLPVIGPQYNYPGTVKRFPSALILTSRGCPNVCKFCANPFGRKSRTHSAGYIVAMMEHLRSAYGIREIMLRDDNSSCLPGRIEELCRVIMERGLDMSWNCLLRVDAVNPERLALMKKAGCWQIWLGLESGSDRVLNISAKGISTAKSREAVHMVKAAGLSPAGLFMVGLPGETVADIELTIKMALELPLEGFVMSHFRPLPGSEFYSTAEHYGRFNDDWEKSSGWRPIFVPDGLSEEELVSSLNSAYRRFFLRPRIIAHLLSTMTSWNHIMMYMGALQGFLAITSSRRR